MVKQHRQQRNTERGACPAAGRERVLPAAWEGAESITRSTQEPRMDLAFGLAQQTPLLLPAATSAPVQQRQYMTSIKSYVN